MEYLELVKEARSLIRRRKEDRDRLIALTVEALIRPGISPQQWASDIGVHPATVRDWSRFARETQARGRDYDEWYQETRRDEADRASSSTRSLPPERKAEVVKQWLADDDGGQTRAEVGRVLHQHDTDVEQHVTDIRQARTNEGERPDFEATESVQRVLAAYAELAVASDRLPATLADRSKSLIAYAAARVLPTVQYHAGFEHEHGLTDDELEKWFS